MVLFIPFEFNRLDSSIIRNYYSQTYQTEVFGKIELLIIDFCKRSIYSSSRIGEAVGKCIAVIFRRPDMCDLQQYKELLYWGIENLGQVLESNERIFYAVNIYKILNQMIKNIKREFIIDIHRELFEKIIRLDLKIKDQQKEFNIEEPANLTQ